MNGKFSDHLNELLVETFYTIEKVEVNALKSTGKEDLSISEFHILECIGKNGDGGRTVGDIAQSMSVTLPTVTVAVNRLEKKGYVNKNKSAEDGRMVYITLTKPGRKMNAAHRYFHETMIRDISREFGDGELELLIRCIERLNSFIKRNSYFKYGKSGTEDKLPEPESESGIKDDEKRVKDKSGAGGEK